jgi:hypothetical protein
MVGGTTASAGDVRIAEGRGAMAGDSRRTTIWWLKNGRAYAYIVGLLAWVFGILALFFSLSEHFGFDATSPLWMTLLVVVLLIGVMGIGGQIGLSGLPERYWRPRVAVLTEWAKSHGGAEDATPVDVPFNRKVVRGELADERRTVWSAHAAGTGYPIRLLLQGVSGADKDNPDTAATKDLLPKIHYTAMIADTGVKLPHMVVAVPRSDPDEHLLPTDTERIEFESAEFNDRWEVRCADVPTGYKVFDPRTIEILLELQASDIRILWEGKSVAVARQGLDFDAEELDRWLALIDRMVHNGRLIGRSA